MEIINAEKIIIRNKISDRNAYLAKDEEGKLIVIFKDKTNKLWAFLNEKQELDSDYYYDSIEDLLAENDLVLIENDFKIKIELL